MMKIVSFKICPFVQRVTALLEAKNIAYEIEYISLKDKPQWFLEFVPTAQVPVLITDSGTTLFESDAIVEYLDEIYPPLEANLSPEQRALDRAWSYQASKHYLVQCGAMSSADEEALNQRSDKLAKAFEKAESQLESGPYFKGDSLSNIDIAWLPLLHRATLFQRKTGHDFVARYPKVKTWQENLLATGLAQQSVSDDFEEAFTSAYIADNTFFNKTQRCSDTQQKPCC